MTRLQGIHVEFVKLAFYLCVHLSVFALVFVVLCKSRNGCLCAQSSLAFVGRVGRPGAAFSLLRVFIDDEALALKEAEVAAKWPVCRRVYAVAGLQSELISEPTVQ